MDRYRWVLRLWSAVATVTMVAGLTVQMCGQGSPQQQRVPMVDDWSTHHLVFSNPGTFGQAIQTRPFLEWYKVQTDPRHRMEQTWRNADRLRGAGANIVPAADFGDSLGIKSRRPYHSRKPQGDWSNYLGGTSNAGIGATLFPVKYTWDINATPDCTNDFVAVPVNEAPAALADATGTITIASEPPNGSTTTIGSIVYTWRTTCGASADCVTPTTSTTTDAHNLAGAIDGSCDGATCTANPDVTATSSTNAVTLTPTAAFAGSAGNSVALATNTGNITLSAATLTGGRDGQASIIAFNNLYTGAAVAASQIGTVSSNSASGGQTVTVGSLVVTASPPVQATGLVTISSNPTNAQDVYIEVKGTGDEYAFHDTLADCGTAKCVLIGSSTTATAANLVAAIGGSCLRLCTAADPNVKASSAANVVTLTAITPGTGGNSITLAAVNNAPTVLVISGATLGTGTGTVAGSNGVNTGTNFAYWSGSAAISASALATNIAAAITRGAATAGATATASGGVISVTASSTGTSGNSIALGETLSGFSWGGTDLAGGTASGLCGTGSPNVLWAYKASTAGTASPMLGSPILSLDGTKIAFIESATSGAILHVLRWKSGDGGTNLSATPVAPTTSTSNASTYATCLSGTTSCMFNLPLGTNNNTNSPPFYNYATDVLYVGDNGGLLWKVTGIFEGTPTIAAAPWSAGVLVDSGSILTGPVYDFGSENIFVADSNGRLSFVSDSTGLLSATKISGLGEITDPPIVDSSTGKVIVFSGGNGTSAIVEQATTSLGSATSLNIGNSSPATPVHSGMFDNLYFTTGPSAGHLYVCGKQPANAAPALYSIAFDGSGVMTSIAGGPLNLTTDTAAHQCAPLSEVYNPNEGGGVDWLFLGVPANCAFGAAATGCIMSFEITSGTMPAGAFATAAESGGTSGIVVDNVSTSGQASSAYFTTLSSPGAGACNNEPSADSTNCLVKRTQAGLQ